ncbi:26S proteasome non-ATPase regulatory subunit 7-like protein A [Raphanus sativus]|nr:26S proteasome non-ATPase regulatory subunit 7-like protein A [Raphanus sativus]
MEDVVGWYSTCFTFQGNDLDLHAMFRGYVGNPVLVLVDVQSKEVGIPTMAYCALEDDVNDIAKEPFIHVSTEIAPPTSTTTSTLVSEMPDRGGGLVDFIECHYSFVKNKVQISVEGYDLSL